MEMCFARQEPDRLVRLREGDVRALPGKRLAARVVGVVGGLPLLRLFHRGRERLRPDFPAGRVFRGVPAIGLDALLRRRVAREQSLEPAAVAVGAQLHEGFLERHGALDVVAGALHVLDPVAI